MLTPHKFRTAEERLNIQAQAQANLAFMAKIYKKPKAPAAAPLSDLHRAIIASDLEAVRKAVDHETVNQVAMTGLTPLHLAVFAYGRVAETTAWQRAQVAGRKTVQEQIVDLLLEQGARVDVWDHAKRLPAACCEGKKMPPSLMKAMADTIEATSIPATGAGTGIIKNAFLHSSDFTPDSQKGRR